MSTQGWRALGVALPVALLTPFWSWSDLPQGRAVSILALCLAALLCWKASTRDIDPVFGDVHRVARRWLLMGLVLSFFGPGGLLLVVVLLSTPFSTWEHHATLPMRVLAGTFAWTVLAGLLSGVGATEEAAGLFASAGPLVWFVVTMQVSHYLITALAKMWLGPRWYSWVTDNHMHHLAASAYSWGWARFLPWRTWSRFIAVLRRGEKPMQAAAFGVELLAPLALLHPLAALGFCGAWAGFHLGVFAVSGLLFWDWVLTNLAIAAMLWWMPSEALASVFGPLPLLAAMAYMVAFPLRHKLWKPIPLGWWDTPFTQRMHWRAHGRSGKTWGVYNDFMGPHERLYGKLHACFLAPDRGITYHLGEVWKHELRDAIREAGPDLGKLAAVRDRFGIQPRDEEMARDHPIYLRRFFHAVNQGARKSVLPRGLRWLKAPGDQVFYWGELPAFRGQEEVVEVSLHYREEYFDGEELVRLQDEEVLRVPIDESAATLDGPPEPTPKDLDDLLLRHAVGKIIDLPGFGEGFVGVDDG